MDKTARRVRLTFGLASLLTAFTVLAFGGGPSLAARLVLIVVWGVTPIILLYYVRSLIGAIILGSFLLGTTVWQMAYTLLSEHSTAGIGLVVTPILQFLVVGIGAHIDSSRHAK